MKKLYGGLLFILFMIRSHLLKAVEFQDSESVIGLDKETKVIANYIIIMAFIIWGFIIARKVYNGGNIKKEVIQLFSGLLIWYVANQIV